MYETYFRSLKGGQMIAWSAAIATGVLQFCNAHGIAHQDGLLAAGGGAAVSALLFFLNPKARGWVESHEAPDLADTVRAVVGELRSADGGPRNFSPPRPPAPPPAPEPIAPADTSPSISAPDPLDAVVAILRAAGKL